MKAAVYLAIFLHFVRKILAKVSVRPSVPDTFLRFSPGEPVGLDIVVEDSISIAIYNRVIQFPPGTSREDAWRTLNRLNQLDPAYVFGRRGESGEVPTVRYGVSAGSTYDVDVTWFRRSYGIRAYGIIRMVVMKGKLPELAHPL